MRWDLGRWWKVRKACKVGTGGETNGCDEFGLENGPLVVGKSKDRFDVTDGDSGV